MENVGQQLIFHMEAINHLVEQLNDHTKVIYGHIRIDAKQGIWDLPREEVMDIVQRLMDAGFEKEETTRDTYKVDTTLLAPGSNMKVHLSHRTTEADKLEVLKEKAEKAQRELEEWANMNPVQKEIEV